LFCLIEKNECREAIFNSPIGIESLNSKHATLIKRLNKYYQFNEFTTQTNPNVSEPLPPYNFVNRTERIFLLQSVYLHQHGESREAVNRLMERYTILVGALERQDLLLGKVVFLRKLSEIVDTLSIIISESNLSMKTEILSNLNCNL